MRIYVHAWKLKLEAKSGARRNFPKYRKKNYAISTNHLRQIRDNI